MTPVSTRKKTRKAVVSLVALALAAALWAASRAGSALVVAAPLEDPDAILSLASHEWERLPAAAALAARYPEAIVALTLPPVVNTHNCHDCANRAKWLARAGVDPRRIHVLPLTVSNTYGEALAAREFLVRSGLKRLVIVTTPYHTRRSLATFRAVLDGKGIAVGTVPASASSPARPERWWGTPYDRAYVAYEWAAVVYYLGRYHVPPSSRQSAEITVTAGSLDSPVGRDYGSGGSLDPPVSGRSEDRPLPQRRKPLPQRRKTESQETGNSSQET